MQTNVLPARDIPNEAHKESALSPQKEIDAPKGIAPLNSTIGIIEIINVARALFVPKIPTNNALIHSDINLHLIKLY